MRGSAAAAHHARLHQARVTRKTTRPSGNYDHAEHQFGVIKTVHDEGPTLTVDVYPNGTQTTANPANVMYGVGVAAGYVPTVGDTVLIFRGKGRLRMSRIVLCKANGAASPYPVPLGGLDAEGRWVQGPGNLWGGEGAPSASLGVEGDYYLRRDTPSVSDQCIYVRQSGGWAGIL